MQNHNPQTCHICKERATPKPTVTIAGPKGIITGKILDDCGTFIKVRWMQLGVWHVELFPKQSKMFIVRYETI